MSKKIRHKARKPDEREVAGDYRTETVYPEDQFFDISERVLRRHRRAVAIEFIEVRYRPVYTEKK